MTSIRIPFESYAAQVAQQQNYNSNSNFRRNETSNIDTTYTVSSVNNHTHSNNNPATKFQFQPRVTFSIQSVDEDEDPEEEKMHSPRTPYGSVPDSVRSTTTNSSGRIFRFNNNNNNNNNTLFPPGPPTLQPRLESMQRTVSASSFESIRSASFENDNILTNYAPTLSATSSINRSDLKAVYSTCSTPESISPCNTPKAYKLTLNEHLMEQKMDENDTIEQNQNQKNQNENENENQNQEFGEKTEREQKIDDIHKALMEVKTKKQNGFNIYKAGLATYSAANSGANTCGTVTPNSIIMSRSSSCGSVINGSECSFDDNNELIDHNDLESIDMNEQFVSSGTATPVINNNNNNNNNYNYNNNIISEDEMETPVPMSSDKLIDENNVNECGVDSPFDFTGRNGFGLAQISEDVEHESNDINTPNTNITSESKVTDMTEINVFEMEDVSDCSEDDEDDIMPIPKELGISMDLEEEIILKGSRFQSTRILFLDVDGVLLSTKEQATLGKGENIKFNDDVTSLMCKLYNETDCDIVISSTWQFHTESHLPYLIAYLVACGWKRNKIHTLLDLLPQNANDGINYGREWYEESPYCRCRARGIQKIVQLYGSYITQWCCLDDLPLHSQKPVCIPKKEDIKSIIDRISNAYFKAFTWRHNDKDKLMPEIKYCVKYALTSLPNCIFGSQSYRFGYEYNQTMIYYQADAIAKLCKLTYEVKDNTTYQLILQNMMGVITQYIGANLTYQGDPFITPYLIQTDQNTGITPINIENTITLLTYQNQRNNNYYQSQQQQIHQPNDPNTV